MDGPVGESCVKLPTRTVHRPHHLQDRAEFITDGSLFHCHTAVFPGGAGVGWGGPLNWCLTWRRKLDEASKLPVFHCK